MRKSILVVAAFCVAICFALASEAYSNEAPAAIVSAEWLEKHQNDKNLVLLHIGSREEFDKEHILRAQYISTRDISTTSDENKLTLELPPPERLKSLFEGLGVSNDSRIVLYWGKDWITPTTRVFFTLDYMGLADNVSILDGGMAAWSAAGRGVVADVVTPVKGTFSLETNDLVAKQTELVDAILNNKPVSIIDARSPKYYTGADKGSMPRAGHIPNARNIPYTSFVTEDNTFKSMNELQALFDNAGIVKEKPVVTYCHIGQQASLAYFVAKMLGYEVRIYDGSFQEWSNSEEEVVVIEEDN